MDKTQFVFSFGQFSEHDPPLNNRHKVKIELVTLLGKSGTTISV